METGNRLKVVNPSCGGARVRPACPWAMDEPKSIRHPDRLIGKGLGRFSGPAAASPGVVNFLDLQFFEGIGFLGGGPGQIPLERLRRTEL